MWVAETFGEGAGSSTRKQRSLDRRLGEGAQDLGQRTVEHALVRARIDAPEGAVAAEGLEAAVPDLLAAAVAAVHDRPHAVGHLGRRGGDLALLGPGRRPWPVVYRFTKSTKG